MSPTSLHYSECLKYTSRSEQSVYTATSSSTKHCWNAVHLWNRCCCKSGRNEVTENTWCNVV